MALFNQFPPGTDLTDALLNAAVPLGVRYEQKGSAQSPGNAADLKMKFETAVDTNTDVVASGTGNTDFTLQRTGWWLATAGTRYVSNAGGGERHLFIQTGSTFAIANRIAYQSVSNVGNAPVTLNCGTVKRLTAGTAIIVGLFQNCGASLALDATFGGTCHISLIWLGPA